MTRFLATLLLALSIACGSGDLTAAAFPAQFARAVCQTTARCRAASQSSEHDCEAGSAALYADLVKAIAARRASYDAKLARRCLDELSSRSCSRLETEPVSCLQAVRPLVAPGGQCFWHFECPTGECRGKSAGCPGVCAGVIGSGATCPGPGNEQCDPRQGLRCIGGVCGGLGAAGAACTSVDDCQLGLFCSSATGACSVQGGVNASCAEDVECANGLYCQLSSGGGGGLCATRVARGKPCGEDANHATVFASECQEGLICTGFAPGTNAPTPGVCSTPSEVGKPCTPHPPGKPFPVTGCAGGLTCNGGTCAELPSSGPCADGGQCSSDSYCDDSGNCQALLADGQPCTSAEQCAGHACPSATNQCAKSDISCHEP